MKLLRIAAATVATFVFCVTAATAGAWSDDQKAVWNVIERSWKDEVAKNSKWPANYVHDDAVSWGASWPMPRGKESMVKWSRFGDSAGSTLEYELMPAKVVVSGDTAVAHYAVVSVGENYEKKRERTTEGLIEVLVRDGTSWKFLSLTSFEIGDGD